MTYWPEVLQKIYQTKEYLSDFVHFLTFGLAILINYVVMKVTFISNVFIMNKETHDLWIDQ